MNPMYTIQNDGKGYYNHVTHRWQKSCAPACLSAVRETAFARLPSTPGAHVTMLDYDTPTGWVPVYAGVIQSGRYSSRRLCAIRNPICQPMLITHPYKNLPRVPMPLYDIYNPDDSTFGKKGRKNPYAITEFTRRQDVFDAAKKTGSIAIIYSRNVNNLVRQKDDIVVVPHEWHFLWSEGWRKILEIKS